MRGKRLSRVLVCAAAVPAVLITAACSSGSGDSKSKGTGSSAQQSASGGTNPSASASPSVQAAAYKKLPDACAVLSKKTLTDLVPQGTSGKKGSSDDPSSRASCSWSSLDNNGVKGSQFRWLNVSLLRFDSDTTRGSGEAQAHTYFGQQVKDAKAVDGAKNTKEIPLSGTGSEATAVRYDLQKKEGLFKQQTVVARVENVVVTLDFNGAGLAGEKTPDADDLTNSAEQAIKEAVGAVSSANGVSSSGGSSSGSSASPSKSASSSPSPSKSAANKG
ncbi:DUF3558 family protein [Streptomyces roseochromogenus]|uniref:DUF3558 domain-containing protein n=1 Tax=Streptomyces roseochromogenus subsp. oscitans DS 12.976 TaxID=1352936 RepID=V6KF23_STRRC|nr:DUF3558 family protein [Streptomyces roseochromogenus]EST30667.1 hypothetical protein M878_18290 [Streptomyces roseochromogenus subsp. oscitans DS 12.976]